MPDLILFSPGYSNPDGTGVYTWQSFGNGALQGSGNWGAGSPVTNQISASSDSFSFIHGVLGYGVTLPGPASGAVKIEVGFYGGPSLAVVWYPVGGGAGVQLTNIFGPANDFVFATNSSTANGIHVLIQPVIPSPPRDVSQLFYIGLGTGFTWYALSLIFWAVKWAVSGRGVSSR